MILGIHVLMSKCSGWLGSHRQRGDIASAAAGLVSVAHQPALASSAGQKATISQPLALFVKWHAVATAYVTQQHHIGLCEADVLWPVLSGRLLQGDKTKADKPGNAPLYHIPRAGSFKLSCGQVKPFPRGAESRIMLVGG